MVHTPHMSCPFSSHTWASNSSTAMMDQDVLSSQWLPFWQRSIPCYFTMAYDSLPCLLIYSKASRSRAFCTCPMSSKMPLFHVSVFLVMDKKHWCWSIFKIAHNTYHIFSLYICESFLHILLISNKTIITLIAMALCCCHYSLHSGLPLGHPILLMLSAVLQSSQSQH